MQAEKTTSTSTTKNLKSFANALRKDMTKAEACLWKYALRASMRKGYGFRRQRPVLNFIADFMCKELKLVIEVDGITHTWLETIAKDKIKDEKLKAAGFYILRFDDEDVLQNINWVIEEIDSTIERIEQSLTKS